MTDFEIGICALCMGALSIFTVLWIGEPKPRPIPTEAEMVMMERMAKIAATAQGECK
jgi:hypothetical protein